MLNRLFSGSAGDLSRLAHWNPLGLFVMALAVVLDLFAPKLGRRSVGIVLLLRLVALLIVAVGALITMRRI